MADKILELLSTGNYVSGEKISAQLGITRAAVWKRISSLKEEGYVIESGGKKGYRLDPQDRLDEELWVNQLDTQYIGRQENCVLDTVDSTNSQLKRMAVQGAASGSICVSEEQTSGRGRMSRSWESKKGSGLWLSVLLKPEILPADAPLITLCTALAMAKALKAAANMDVRIKWPNDIVIKGKKLCGILLEVSAEIAAIEYVIIGTGVNFKKTAYSDQLKDKAISVEEITSLPPRRLVLACYLNQLEKVISHLEHNGFEDIRREYLSLSATIGSRVEVTGAVNCRGTALDMDNTGALIVADDEGIHHRILSGDVSVRGIMGYV